MLTIQIQNVLHRFVPLITWSPADTVVLEGWEDLESLVLTKVGAGVGLKVLSSGSGLSSREAPAIYPFQHGPTCCCHCVFLSVMD